MRSGANPPPHAFPAAVVTVAGVLRQTVSVQTRRSLGGGGVPGMTEQAAASGAATWAQMVAVMPKQSVRANPWRRVAGWPPLRRAPVSVAVGTVQAGVYSAGTFVLDTTESSNGEPMSSTFIDPIDKLRRNVTVPPLLARMPPAVEGGPMLEVGLSSDYIVNRVLRSCTIFTTPFLPAGVDGVDIPGQGSMLPARGTVTDSGAYTNTAAQPNFGTANWGWGMIDVDATYEPSGTVAAAAGLDLGMMVSSGHAGTAQINVFLNGRTERFQLAVSDTRVVQLNYFDGATTTTVLSLPAATGWVRVAGRFTSTGASLSTDDGRTVTGTYSPASGVAAAAVSAVRVVSFGGAVVGGMIVANLGSGAYIGQALNGTLLAGTSLNPKMLASTALVNVNALELISEIANATCRAWWWTEDGVFKWMPGDRLLAQSPVTTFTSAESLASIGWEEALTDVFSQVVVEYEAPAIARSAVTAAEVWRGGSQTVNGQDDEFITAPDDEDWFYVGTPQQLVTASITDFNAGPGSWYGATTNAGALVTDPALAVFLNFVTPKTWKLSTFSAAVYDQKVPDLAAIKKWKQGEALPVLRARAKTSWAANSQTFGSGPSDAPEYRHDGGRWLQGYAEEGVPAVGNFLASWLCTSHPRLTNIRLVHDARAQVGDVVILQDDNEYGMAWTVLVTKIEQSTSAADQSMSIDCYVISTVNLGRTYGEYDEANAAGSYSQFDSANAARTYGDPWPADAV